MDPVSKNKATSPGEVASQPDQDLETKKRIVDQLTATQKSIEDDLRQQQGDSQQPNADDAENHLVNEPVKSEVPEWVAAILDSNDRVIASNEAVIASIEQFKDSAIEVAGAMVKEVQRVATEDGGDKPVELDLPKIKSKAKYVVAPGKKFQDKDNPEFIYSEGTDVTDLDNERLARLLAMDIIVEARDND